MVWYIFMIFCSNQFLLLLLDVVVVYSVSHVQLFLRSHWPWPARPLCSWDFPCKNTRVGCCFLLQGNFPTQQSNPSLLHHRWILYHWTTRGATRFFLLLLLNGKILMPIILAKGTSSLMNNYLRNIIDK